MRRGRDGAVRTGRRAVHRAAAAPAAAPLRAILDPMLNLGLIDRASAGRVLEGRVGVSPAMAKQELDRYMFNSPGQAGSYFYGYSRLPQTRMDAELALGAKFDSARVQQLRRSAVACCRRTCSPPRCASSSSSSSWRRSASLPCGRRVPKAGEGGLRENGGPRLAKQNAAEWRRLCSRYGATFLVGATEVATGLMVSAPSGRGLSVELGGPQAVVVLERPRRFLPVGEVNTNSPSRSVTSSRCRHPSTSKRPVISVSSSMVQPRQLGLCGFRT